jgi:diguanylate cyclase (GGDEF)-like protein
MDHTEPRLSQASGPPAIAQIQSTMRGVTRRQSWLWFSAVAVTLVLTLCIATFSFPGLLSQQGWSYAFNLDLAVRGLIGLVLLFNVYTIYQQLQIHRIQGKLNEQIGTLGRLDRIEERTEEAYKLAAFDSLTGLYNRKSGELRLAEEILRSKRHTIPLTVLMLDLNGLKQTNDIFGHAAGDLVLKVFAERIQRAVRGSDVPIRLGGDEFLVLLPECKLSEVQIVLNRLNALKVDYEGQEIQIEFAAGWTDYISGESPEALMVRADGALYASKRNVREKLEISQAPATEEVRSDVPPLSPRELEVLRLLGRGRGNKEVADALNISVRTVETHRANIMAKLDLHSIAELVLYVSQNKIV